MSANGRQSPRRPDISISGRASPEEAAAIAAALEQFLRDTAPAPVSAKPAMSPWARAGLFEGAGYAADAPGPWTTADGEPWGR